MNIWLAQVCRQNQIHNLHLVISHVCVHIHRYSVPYIKITEEIKVQFRSIFVVKEDIYINCRCPINIFGIPLYGPAFCGTCMFTKIEDLRQVHHTFQTEHQYSIQKGGWTSHTSPGFETAGTMFSKIGSTK